MALYLSISRVWLTLSLISSLEVYTEYPLDSHAYDRLPGVAVNSDKDEQFCSWTYLRSACPAAVKV